MEPMKHQYDFDSATAIGFLREYGLENDFKINIEVNHATLAQHTMQHELAVAAKAICLEVLMPIGEIIKMVGIQINFLTIFKKQLKRCLCFQAGGLQGGGVNFDAKIRRNSTDMEDVFLAHIGGADTFARALITADKILTLPL
jgi:xylose isomerase